jgi:HK97 family phage prohead protease
MKIEKRSNGTIGLDGEKERCVTGYAHKYGTVNEFQAYSLATGGYITVRETFDVGAFDYADKSSAYFRHNHDMRARGLAHPRNDTLKIIPDENGLRYVASLSDTQAGRDLYTDVKSGLITEMSFAFTVDENDESAVEYKRLNDELLERRVKKVNKLYDVSTVDYPAFSGTSVEAKALENGKEQIENRSSLAGLDNFLRNEMQEQRQNADNNLALEKQKLTAIIDTYI